MPQATIRWITNPLLRANQVLLGMLDGEYASPEEFVTPYKVDVGDHSSPITVHTKYVFPRGTTTEYFYEVEGDDEVVEDLMNRARNLSFQILTLTYSIPPSDKVFPYEDLQGVLPILKVVVRKALLGESKNPFSEISIDKILFNQYKNPDYIVFRPITKILKARQEQELELYRAHLSNPLGTIQKYNQYEPEDDGEFTTSPIYLPEDVIADVRSKVDIESMIGYTLLYHNSMPYHILDEWAIAHDYDREAIKDHLKRVNKDITLIKNHLVHNNPDSIFWDLKSRSEVKEGQGYFVKSIDEVLLAEDSADVYLEIANTFGFEHRKTRDVPNELILKVPKDRSFYGNDVMKWIDESRESIYSDKPILLRLEGDWVYGKNLPLSAESYAKVYYAAYRGFAKIVENNPYAITNNIYVSVMPDLSIVVPCYTPELGTLAKEEVEGVLNDPTLVNVMLCDNLKDCVAFRANTKEKIPNSIPFSITVNGQYILASNSSLMVIGKPGDYPEEVKSLSAKGDELDPNDPSVQGFTDFGEIKGSVTPKSPSQFYEKVSIIIVELGGRLYASAVISPEKTIDLFSIPIPKHQPKRKSIVDMKKYSEVLWKDLWFLTEWAKQHYINPIRHKKELSTHLTRDVQDQIKSFRDLKRISDEISKRA